MSVDPASPAAHHTTEPVVERDVEADAVYVRITDRLGAIIRTVPAGPSVNFDVDDYGRVVGIEVLGSHDWTRALAELLLRGEVRLVHGFDEHDEQTSAHLVAALAAAPPRPADNLAARLKASLAAAAARRQPADDTPVQALTRQLVIDSAQAGYDRGVRDERERISAGLDAATRWAFADLLGEATAGHDTWTDDESELRRVKLKPVDEAEDTWDASAGHDNQAQR